MFFLQQPIWNLEWSVIPQFGYGQSKSINIFGSVQWDIVKQSKTVISIVISILPQSLVTSLKFNLYFQESNWNLEWSVSLNFGMTNPNPSAFPGNEWKIDK